MRQKRTMKAPSVSAVPMTRDVITSVDDRPPDLRDGAGAEYG